MAKPVTKKELPHKPNRKWHNSPVIGDGGLELEKGDNSKYMQVNIALFNMEKIDLHDVEQVNQRLNEYFELYVTHDMKPTVAGMAMALGMNRKTLGCIVHDRPTGSDGYMSALPREVTGLIKKAYNMLEILWETYMNSGKINPVSGIFLGKNNHGYQDKTEHVVTPNMQNDADYDVKLIKERYQLESSEQPEKNE